LYQCVVACSKWQIDTYNVDEHIQRTLPLLDELCGIVLCPLFFLVFTKVAREGLLAPVAVAGVGDGCECGDGLVLAGVLQELEMVVLARVQERGKRGTYQGQGTVATHAVTSDADSVRVQLLEGREQSLGKILGNVRVHVVTLVVRLLCGIDVEASS
jgi:hypothetical protein